MHILKSKWEHLISWYSTWLLWGPRCGDFEPLCHTCRAWAHHDSCFDGPWADNHVSWYDWEKIKELCDESMRDLQMERPEDQT